MIAVGCEGGKPKGELPPLQLAKGTVVRGGQPVHGGSIRFQPEPNMPDIVVTSDVSPQGTFELQTIHATTQKKGTGAPVGTYHVMYYPPQADQVAGGLPALIEVRQTQTIKEGPNELTVELTGK